MDSAAEQRAASWMTQGGKHLLNVLTGCSSGSGSRALTGAMRREDVDALLFDWQPWTRQDQAPPVDGEWHTWLVLGGRGAGKTRTGSEWVRAMACGEWGRGQELARRIAIVGPTHDETRAVMLEGVSGLLAVHPDPWRPTYESSRRLVTWPNGAVAQLFSAEEPDSLRGFQFDAAWCDELAKWKYAEAAWDMLQFGLRLGTDPRCVVTTTPRPSPLIKRLMADKATILSRSTTRHNHGHLAERFLREIERRYKNTTLGRQELDAEVIEDDPAALFKRPDIERLRIAAAPDMRRIVVAIDPPAGKTPRSSACGIVCAGLGLDGRAYVLDDCSVQGRSPTAWARKAVALYHARKADRIVAEVNQGGALVEAVIRQIDQTVAYRPVHATRAKQVRAEPVAALYEQGRVSHVGCFPELEDEMCAGFEGAKSPDRLDALVWALSELMLAAAAEPRIRWL